MSNVTVSLDQAMKSMNLEQVAKIMDKFETQFENLDVHATVCLFHIRKSDLVNILFNY